MENWESCWFRLVKGGATFSKISQVSYMWTRLIAVSISDWVNLDHLRISTFGWKNSNSAFFTLILFPITGISAYIWYFSQSRTRYLCQNNIAARVKYHLMPIIPQKFIIISLRNYRFHHYRCNPRYLSNSAKSQWNIFKRPRIWSIATEFETALNQIHCLVV